jgi:hypothetical protein
MADILHRAQGGTRRQDAPREVGVSRPVLLALALAFACVGLALAADLTIVAIVPILLSIIAVLAAFRVMG